ncbi:MAG TPA: universal stress protein [Pyrinomonadaceae bacterium]|nr:universal stress protein [Pyrinomonadaceae bacterium]
MKLLIAVDSGISAEVLVDAVRKRPWPDGTTAHVLSIVADMDVPTEVWREEGYGKNAVRTEMQTRGEQINPAVERLKEHGIPTELVVARGDARHLIPYFARKWSSDLILVRAHVRKDLTHWMLGSVARAVVGDAPCTVQIVRDLSEERAHTRESARRVLLATDGSETSTAAAQALAGWPWPKQSEFKIVSVEEPWAIKQSRVGGNEQAQEAVASAKQVLASGALEAIGEVLSGNPKEVILEEARKWDADLIVVGSHGRRGFKRFLLGSVSEAVAMNAHCSVVVVRALSRSRKRGR